MSVHTYMHACMHACTHTYMYMYIYIYMYMYMHTVCIHAYLHTYIHVYTCICMCVCAFVLQFKGPTAVLHGVGRPIHFMAVLDIWTLSDRYRVPRHPLFTLSGTPIFLASQHDMNPILGCTRTLGAPMIWSLYRVRCPPTINNIALLSRILTKSSYGSLRSAKYIGVNDWQHHAVLP